MRWIRYTAAGTTAYGILERETIVAVRGTPFGDWQRTGRTHMLADVKIELPVVPPTPAAGGALRRRPRT